MLHREIPFLRIGVSLCAGIVCGYVYCPGKTVFIASFTIIVTSFFISLYYNHHISNKIYGITLTFALFISGLLLYKNEKSSISVLYEEENFFSGYLSDYPEEKENTFKMTFRLGSGMIADKQIPLKGSILLYHKKDSTCYSYLPGDRFILRCKPLEITNRGNPAEFDYRFHMENRGIKFYAFTDSGDILWNASPSRRTLLQRALIVREHIIGMFRERGIEGDRLALVSAITLGQKNMLDPEQKQYFIKAGVMHIMAVSGLHAVILSLFIFKLLFFLKGNLNFLRVLITLILLWMFAFVTGLTPSVLRATIMFTFLQTGTLMKRPVNPINSVLASAVVLILIRPSVIFDAGFLLSYSAVIFIISFYRDLYLKLRFSNRLPDLIWQTAAVSIIAQAGTLPLTIMLFNRFPTWFILSNLIIVPLSSIVIITGCLVPLTFPLIFISRPLAWVLDFLTGLTEYLTATAAALPYSTIDNIGLTITDCILLTLSMFMFLRYVLVRKSISIAWPLTALLCLVLLGTARDIKTRRSKELIIYNSIGHPEIGIRTGKILSIYSDTSQPGPEVYRHSATLGLKLNTSNIQKGTSIIETGKNKILITDHLKNSIMIKYKPDILILTGRKPSLEKIVLPAERFRAVIVSSGTNPGFQVSQQIRSLNADTVHFTGKDGAFRLKL